MLIYLCGAGRCFILMLTLACALFAGPALAHGVSAQVVDRRTVVVEASYSDGEAMSYAKAVVYAPDVATPFLRGRTDRMGRLAFAPTVAGKWRVEIADGMGHKVVRVVEVADPKAVSASTAATRQEPEPGLAGMPLYLKVLVGLSILFGLAGAASLFRRVRGGRS